VIHSKLALGLATSSLLVALAVTVSGRPLDQQAPAAVEPSPAPSDDRKAMLDELVKKWGPYVQANFGADVEVWRERLALRHEKGDATNLRDALLRDTFEGAMAALDGRGHRASDAEITSAMASAANGLNPSSFSELLGSLSNDLVYTPLQPCRIIDTRSMAAGPINASATRSFVAINASNFTSQGGSATNCGTLGLSATAVAINLTAVTPAAAGYSTVYPYGTGQPLAASVNFTAGAVVNNGLIAQIPNPLGSFDFTIFSSAQSHYVADIVGYFSPNVATALQCQDTADTTISVAAAATANAVAPACAAGYTQTATNCESSTWQMPFVFVNGGTCSAQNNSAGTASLRASRTCCRVPGK
jgi:hypothetical protein